MRPRQIFKNVLAFLLYYSGFVYLFRSVRRVCGFPVTRILCFHGVSNQPNYIDMFMEVDKFRAISAYLAQSYNVLSLSKVMDIKRNGKQTLSDSIAITVDDGYRDNYTNMFPILKQYNLPATIFLSTHFIETGFPTFIYAILIAMKETKEEYIDLSASGMGRYKIKSLTQKRVAIREINKFSKKMGKKQQDLFLSIVLSKLGFSGDDSIFENSMLSWSEILEMRKDGIDFGAHTVNHPVLSGLLQEEACDEIVKSKQMIEQKLMEPVRYFAYPYGNESSINLDVIQCVKNAGFDGAVVLFNKRQRVETPFTVDRKMVSQDMVTGLRGQFSKSLFACEMSGIYDLLFLRS